VICCDNDVEGVFESWGWSLQSTECLRIPKVTGSGRYRFILPTDVHVILLFNSFIWGILIYPPLKGSTIATRQTPGWIISEFKQPIVRDHGTFPGKRDVPGMLYGNILRLNLSWNSPLFLPNLAPSPYSSSQDLAFRARVDIFWQIRILTLLGCWAADVL